MKSLENNKVKFHDHEISVIIDVNSEFWFNIRDIAKALEYKDIKDIIKTGIDNKYKKSLKNIKVKNLTNDLFKKHGNTAYTNESGFYMFLMNSRLKKAKEFKNWVIDIVLPSIRKYGKYKFEESHNEEMFKLTQEMDILQKTNNILENDLKKDKYPNGSVFYVIKYSDGIDNYYRIGQTKNMNERKKVYESHLLHKPNVVIVKEVKCGLKFETCIRSLLYDYRVKDKKDFYKCNIKTIESAIKKCEESIKCIEELIGGFIKDSIKDNTDDITVKEIIEQRLYLLEQSGHQLGNIRSLLKHEIKKLNTKSILYKIIYCDDDDYLQNQTNNKLNDIYVINNNKLFLVKEIYCPKELKFIIEPILDDYKIKSDFFECNIDKIRYIIDKIDDSIKILNNDNTFDYISFINRNIDNNDVSKLIIIKHNSIDLFEYNKNIHDKLLNITKHLIESRTNSIYSY